MTLYEVTVSAKEIQYHESFRLFGTSKRHAMMKGIGIARKCDNVKGELLAIAKVAQ